MVTRVTIDTNVVPLEDLLAVCPEGEFEFIAVGTTERELRPSDLDVSHPRIRKVLEIGVWDETEWNGGRWVSDAEADRFEAVLSIISSGAFPRERERLSEGQKRQFRDAMIFNGHLEENADIFVSNDTRAFVKHGRREELQNRFDTQIMTQSEFIESRK